MCCTRSGSETCGQLQGGDLGQAQRGDARHLEAEQEPARSRRRRRSRARAARRPGAGGPGRSLRTCSAVTRSVQRTRSDGGLRDLLQQTVDLTADEADCAVGLLGEQLVAGSATGHRGQQPLVVAEAEAEGRGGDAPGVRLGGDAAQTWRVADAGVGVPVADEQDGGPGGAGDAPRLLQTAQVAAGQVGAAAGLDGRDRALRRRPCRSAGPAGTTTCTASSKATMPSWSAGSSRSTRASSAVHRAVEALAAHRPAAVEHDLEGRGRAGRRRDRCGGGELDEQGELVGLLDGDEVAVEP